MELMTRDELMGVISGTKTGRSPKDKRIVEEETSKDDVWFGPVNIPLSEDSFMVNRERAIDYLNTREQLYVFDGYAGWDAKYRIKIRVISTRAYHALFMRNMLIRPTPQELMDFGGGGRERERFSKVVVVVVSVGGIQVEYCEGAEKNCERFQ